MTPPARPVTRAASAAPRDPYPSAAPRERTP